MKKLFLALILLVSCISAQALEVQKLNGTDRSMIVYAPKDLPENAPLFISCHGAGQGADYQQGQSKFEALADQKKFVIVYPNGIGKYWDISGESDIKFMDAIINLMVKRYKIDRKRVYISGFSMGGMFTYHCANKMANRVAAFCPVSGYPMGGPNPAASRAVPILHTHGTADDVCVYSSVQSHIDAWVTFNKCNSTPVTISPYPSGTNSPAVMKKYKNGTDGVEVWLLTLKDKGHWWSMDTAQANTTEEVYNFCMKWTLENPVTPTTEFEANEMDFDEIDPTREYEYVPIFDAQLDTTQVAVGEGIPAGWKRVNEKDGNKETTPQNSANVSGVRMKFFEPGGDFNSGFYLSARDNSRCDLYYGTYAAHRLYLDAGLYDVTFNATYWSQGAADAGATFAFNLHYIATSGLTKVKGSSDFRPTGCVAESTQQQITGSKEFRARFTVETPGNYVLNFAMDQGWLSVIVGNVKVFRLTDPNSDAIECIQTDSAVKSYDLQGRETISNSGLQIKNGHMIYIK